MNQRIVESFLDVLVLLELRKEEALSDQKAVTCIQKKFLLEDRSESLSVLDVLEKSGFIMKRKAEKANIYALTDKGLKTANTLLNLRDKILGLVLSEHANWMNKSAATFL